jgi:L-amino acid N-acyltransferase YncA
MGVRRPDLRADPGQRAGGREPPPGLPQPLGHALNVTIRAATAADLTAVGQIFGWYAVNSAATFEDAPRSTADWLTLHDELTALGLPFLVADADGTVAGYAYAGPWRRKAAYRATVEDSVFIAPRQTGRGLGRRLLTDLLTACAQAGARQVIAVIADSADAPASVRLHESCGFRPAGRLESVGFKHGRWIDTMLLQRSLG